MEKNSFILYHEYAEHFSLLTDEELGKLMRAIMVYDAKGVVPELEGMAKMAFSFIKKDLDISREKYNAKCERNRQNGQQGGRGNKTEETESENKKAKESEKSERFFSKPKKSERFLEKPKKADNDSDNDSDNENDSGSGSYITTAAADSLTLFYEENIGKVTVVVATKIREWLSKVDASLIEYAIEQAVLHNTKKWAYINSILDTHYKAGRTTAEQVAEERQYRNDMEGEDLDFLLLENYGT